MQEPALGWICPGIATLGKSGTKSAAMGMTEAAVTIGAEIEIVITEIGSLGFFIC